MHAVLGHSLMHLSCLPRLCGSGILECTRISCSLRLRREPILKPASCRHLVVSEAPRRSQWLLRIVWKTWFSGWWVRTRKEGLVTVAGSTSSLVSSSDARGKLSDEAVGMPLDRSWVLSWARALSRAVCISWAEGLFGVRAQHRTDGLPGAGENLASKTTFRLEDSPASSPNYP